MADNSNDESKESINKPKRQFLEGADYKGTYRWNGPIPNVGDPDYEDYLFCIQYSPEFGVPVSGTKAAKSLESLLLRNPGKLQIFRMFILSQCTPDSAGITSLENSADQQSKAEN